jgi:hypothetical protein
MRGIRASDVLLGELRHDPLTRIVTIPILRDERRVIVTVPNVAQLVVDNPRDADSFPTRQGGLRVDTNLHGQMFLVAAEDTVANSDHVFPACAIVVYIDSDEITEAPG